jgi:MoaA/NifB/PqqE/SkfB family radical SAM enzyme
MAIRTYRIKTNEQGQVLLPEDLLQKLGITPSSLIRIEEGENEVTIQRSSSSLAEVYIELTNRCNLDCRTCMRNVWHEPMGDMREETFAAVLESVKAIQPAPKIFFGGFGEPLAHKRAVEMIARAKASGSPVEMITNGILLTKDVALRLVDIGIDRVWVSIDGATPESYEDVRLGDALPTVLENIYYLMGLLMEAGKYHPNLGIAFVAMKRNQGDLAKVIQIGRRLGADRFSVSNVLPHTEELRDQILYSRSMNDGNLHPSAWAPVISLPRLDPSENLVSQLQEAVRMPVNLEVGGRRLDAGSNTCPFIKKGSVSVRWDGEVSPCLSLLHTHESYLDDHIRQSQAFSVGNVNQSSLLEIWNGSEYTDLRERLLKFDFSPCTFCNSCYMADDNLEDCFGNVQPACGGCLWGQGFIQCP